MKFKEIFTRRDRTTQTLDLEGERLKKENKEKFYDITNDWVVEIKLNKRFLEEQN